MCLCVTVEIWLDVSVEYNIKYKTYQYIIFLMCPICADSSSCPQ